MARFAPTAAGVAVALFLSACATPGAPGPRTATVQRTTNGIAHIIAPDFETLAYGAAYAHAQDNVCQTANQLVTARAERARYFGGGATLGLLGRRMLPNEVSDFFVAQHMDDAVLARSWSGTSADAQAIASGYVAGYNRYLADKAGRLPPACNGQPWVRPMTVAEFARVQELIMVQASSAALADAVVGAQPPKPTAALPAPVNLVEAAQAARDIGLLDSPLGSNAWAFGKETTANGSGVLLGNPHFPWDGINRFWQMHLTIPGQLDVMGASTGLSAVISIGFNKNVAWSHTVSTGKRFTLHELILDSSDPTVYVVDGKAEKMSSRQVTIAVNAADGTVSNKTRTVWTTRFGPVVVIARAGLNWTVKNAYALKDVNATNTRFVDSWIGINKAASVAEIRDAHRNLGIPWVNTIAIDRSGHAMYADVSRVPDVTAAQLERCAPSRPAAALFKAAGLVVLDGSKSSCDWNQDSSSPVPGITPIERMPVAIRTDWVHNSNDSFFYSNPAQRFGDISPLVGDASVTRPRTRAGLIEIPEMMGRGKVTLAAVQNQLFENRNTMARFVLPDLLAACATNPPANPQAVEGCAALKGWNRTNDLEARGAHLFREFWRTARLIPGVHRVAFDPAQPALTPSGLKLDDPAVGPKIWDALAQAVSQVRTAGFALDATLGSVQWPMITEERIPVHGGDEFEGVLNNLGNQFAPGINAKGLRIDYGSSYIQSVTFDERGPIAQAILTYGQATDPASPYATDQTKLFSKKQWPVLPFHPEDVTRDRIGDAIRLTMP